MSVFTFHPYQYRRERRGLTKWQHGDTVVNPLIVNYDKAVTDFICHQSYWEPQTLPRPEPKRSFDFLSWIRPFGAGKAPEIKTAPVFFDAQVMVNRNDVSIYADEFNGSSTRGLKAHFAREITSRLKAKLVSEIELSAQGDGSSSPCEVSEVKSNGYGYTFTVQIPETILNRTRGRYQPNAIPA